MYGRELRSLAASPSVRLQPHSRSGGPVPAPDRTPRLSALPHDRRFRGDDDRRADLERATAHELSSPGASIDAPATGRSTSPEACALRSSAAARLFSSLRSRRSLTRRSRSSFANVCCRLFAIEVTISRAADTWPGGHRRSRTATFGRSESRQGAARIGSSRASLPALTAMVDRARSGGNEVLMQVLSSFGRKLRKWLGLDKQPAGKLHGTGA